MAISQHGTSILFTSHPKDGLVVNLYIPHNRRTPLQAEEALGAISIPRVPAGLAPFRGLVPQGRRNMVPILSPAHPLGGGSNLSDDEKFLFLFSNNNSYIFCFTANICYEMYMYILIVFSSPDPKGHVSFCHHFASVVVVVVRVCKLFILSSSSLKPLN